MWANTHRHSSYINWVLFTIGERGTYESDEIPEDKIEWFRNRPHIFTMVASGVAPDPDSLDLQEPELAPLPTPIRPKPRKRPVLKD